MHWKDIFSYLLLEWIWKTLKYQDFPGKNWSKCDRIWLFAVTGGKILYLSIHQKNYFNIRLGYWQAYFSVWNLKCPFVCVFFLCICQWFIISIYWSSTNFSFFLIVMNKLLKGEMYTILTGAPFPHICPHTLFIYLLYSSIPINITYH